MKHFDHSAVEGTLFEELLDDYGPIIDDWFKASKKYEDQLNLKEIAKLSGKEIQKLPLVKINKETHLYMISPRSKYFDLSSYYDNPNTYYYDVIRTMNALKKDIVDTDSYYDFIYADGRYSRMSCIHFLFNLIMWMPFFMMRIRITEKLLFHPKVFTNGEYVNYYNTKLIDPYKHMTTANQMSAMLSKVYDYMITITEKAGTRLGMSFSMYDIISRWEHNPRLKDINHTKIPQDMSISDAESMLNEKSKELEDIIMNEETDSQFRPLMMAGTLNRKQFKEYAINISFKPDFEGKTYNTRPQTNFISNGLRDPVDYMTDAVGGRKAAEMALQIDESGYLQRTLCRSASNMFLDPDPDSDCGSRHYYNKLISNKNDLVDMRGRWYLNGKRLTQLVETDYELIGKELSFRSPCTCAGKHGICAVCYGYMHDQNVDIDIGINSAIKIAERTYQNTLSAKHILCTTTTSLKFTDGADDFFYVEDGYRIKLRDDIDTLDNLEILININEVARDNEIDDMYQNEHITGFVIRDMDTKTDMRFDELNNNPLYIGDAIFNKFADKRKHQEYDEEGFVAIPFKEIPALVQCTDEDGEESNEVPDMFFVQFSNKEITKPLKEVKKLIEKGKEIQGVSSISELINRLGSLLKSGGVKVENVHVEVIARNLIRDRDNPINLPDYSKDNINALFTSIHNSIMNSNSVITSLTFERLRDQFSNPETYKKNGVGPLDRLFIKQ